MKYFRLTALVVLACIFGVAVWEMGEVKVDVEASDIIKGQTGPIYPCNSASGSGSAYTCTTGFGITPVTGTMVLWRPDVNCADNPTLSVDGSTARPISGHNIQSLQPKDCLVSGFPGINQFILTYNANTLATWTVSSYQTGAFTNLNCNGTNLIPRSVGTTPAGDYQLTCNNDFSLASGTTLTLGSSLLANFTAALGTAPNKAGTMLPATCTVGQTFFKTDATAGQNLYLCTATNTWTQVSGVDPPWTSYTPTVTSIPPLTVTTTDIDAAYIRTGSTVKLRILWEGDVPMVASSIRFTLPFAESVLQTGSCIYSSSDVLMNCMTLIAGGEFQAYPLPPPFAASTPLAIILNVVYEAAP